MNCVALLFGSGTREQFYVHPDFCSERRQRFKMLCGKNFGRSHQASLCAVVKSHEHAKKRNQSFSGADIAL